MRFEKNIITGESTEFPDAPTTPEDPEALKTEEVEQMMASPLGSSMMEEFLQILNDNNLNVPPNTVENIKSRIRSKL